MMPEIRNALMYHCGTNSQSTELKTDKVQINNKIKFISLNSFKQCRYINC